MFKRLLHAFVIGVQVVVVALVAARLAGLTGSAWGELFAYLPYPLLAIPAALAFLLSWFLNRWFRVASSAGLLLVLTWLMGLSVGMPDTGSGRVRLMTYNIKSYLAVKDKGYAPLVLEVMQHDPDIIVMQDAGQLIARRKVVQGTAQALYEGRQEYAFGQYLILSRFPLRDCGYDLISYRNESHSFARCVVSAHGVDVDLITAHFKTPRDGLNAARHERLAGLDDWKTNVEDRRQQATTLATYISGRRRPAIIAGDLNAPESTSVIRRILAAGMRNAWSSSAMGYGYTHGHSLRPHLSFLRIDHILVSEEIGVLSCVTGGKEASDHRPVIADLLLHRSR